MVNLDRIEGITVFQNVGRILEIAEHIALKINGIPDSPNPLYDKRYAHACNDKNRKGRHVDNEVKITKGLIPIEAKNHKWKGRWSEKWIHKEIFNRFNDWESDNYFTPPPDKDSVPKILVCSFFKGSDYMRWDMENNRGYKIIELGFQVTKNTFKKAISFLVKKFYWLKCNFTFPKPPKFIKKTLDMYNNRDLYEDGIESLHNIYIRDINDDSVRVIERVIRLLDYGNFG